MILKKIYKFANKKLYDELKDDVGKLKFKNDLTTSLLLKKKLIVRLFFQIEKI